MRLVFTSIAIAATAAVALALTPPALAKARLPGGHTAVHSHMTKVSTGHARSLASHGKRAGWHHASTPPGWSHGKKTGWHGGKMPPGQPRHS